MTIHGPEERRKDIINETTLRRVDDRPLQPTIATVLASGLLIVVTFQVALTLGAPFGAAAMGGTNPGRLPDPVRIVTGFQSVMWFLAALIVLARGGRGPVLLPPAVVRVGTRVLVGLPRTGRARELRLLQPMGTIRLGAVHPHHVWTLRRPVKKRSPQPARELSAMSTAAPSFWRNLSTLGIAQARWIADVNAALGHKGGRFMFAWFLSPFANYGVSRRINAAHQSVGSSTRISPIACFVFTGLPGIGVRERLKRSIQEYGSMLAEREG